MWYYFSSPAALIFESWFTFAIYLLSILMTGPWKFVFVSSLCREGWGLLTTVAALSCFGVLGLQRLFCELNHSQKASKEAQPEHPRWGELCRCIFARSAVICNSSRRRWLIFIYVCFSVSPSPWPPPRWFKYQLNKRCQWRGPFRLGRRSPSSQNRWLQPCPWLMHKLPYKLRLLSSNPCRQLCSLWLNQPRSTSSQLPLQVSYRITTRADVDVLLCTRCIAQHAWH